MQHTRRISKELEGLLDNISRVLLSHLVLHKINEYLERDTALGKVALRSAVSYRLEYAVVVTHPRPFCPVR